eukprot:scaffold2952_cov141-Skeletonema_dohrnii-CCMP3373.AAC.3
MQRLKGACRFRINETYYVDDIAAFFHFHLRRDLNIGLLSSKALPPSDYFMILRLEQEHRSALQHEIYTNILLWGVENWALHAEHIKKLQIWVNRMISVPSQIRDISEAEAEAEEELELEL